MEIKQKKRMIGWAFALAIMRYKFKSDYSINQRYGLRYYYKHSTEFCQELFQYIVVSSSTGTIYSGDYQTRVSIFSMSIKALILINIQL